MEGSISDNYVSHKLDEEGQRRCNAIRNQALMLATDVMSMVPDGRERALALTKIEEAMFWANAGIARISNTTKPG